MASTRKGSKAATAKALFPPEEALEEALREQLNEALRRELRGEKRELWHALAVVHALVQAVAPKEERGPLLDMVWELREAGARSATAARTIGVALDLGFRAGRLPLEQPFGTLFEDAQRQLEARRRGSLVAKARLRARADEYEREVVKYRANAAARTEADARRMIAQREILRETGRTPTDAEKQARATQIGDRIRRRRRTRARARSTH